MTSPPPRIVVLGAGAAGLEAAFALHARLRGRIDLQLVVEDDEFVLRPNLVYVPFGADLSASRLRISEMRLDAGIGLRPARAEGIDTELGRVHLSDGEQLAFEHLIIATGASTRPQEIPGLRDEAVDIWDAAGMVTLGERFTHVRGKARERSRQRVLFIVPSGCQCSLPLYEVALMLDTWLRREGPREQVEICFATHESSFAEACGPRMHQVIEREFAERGVRGRTAGRVTEVRAREAFFAGGRTEPFDLLVTIPPHGPRVRHDGLPVDQRGFLRVESASRQVVGHPEIYAPGDAGDFPLKDVFLALLQADAVADHVAAVIAGDRFKHPFDAVSMNVIDMLDRAAFAQLPLEVTGEPDHPVRLRAGGEADYTLGVAPVWRMAKRTYASYLLMRFAGGEPFRAGAGWRLMDVGARAMTGMFAEA